MLNPPLDCVFDVDVDVGDGGAENVDMKVSDTEMVETKEVDINIVDMGVVGVVLVELVVVAASPFLKISNISFSPSETPDGFATSSTGELRVQTFGVRSDSCATVKSTLLIESTADPALWSAVSWKWHLSKEIA